MSARPVILMSGNPRAGRTTTASLLRFLDARLREQGATPQRMDLRDMERNPTQEEMLLDGLADGATLVLCFPVFLDAPPAQLLAWMARVADARRERGQQGGALVAVVGSGYPEPIQRRHAREVCRRFAEEAVLEWGGAMDFGATPIIGGRDLEDVGFIAKHIRGALASLAGDLVAGELLSDATRAAAARHGLPVPTFMAPWIMNAMVRKRYRTAGVADPRVQPYAPVEP